MNDYIQPKNWNEFQHYKDRSPSWIKLHKNILDNRDYHRLHVASKALAPLLWLLASEYKDGKIPLDYDLISFRLRMTEKEVENAVTPLIHSGFFILYQDASRVLAECLPREEKRRVREEKSEGDKSPFVLNEKIPKAVWSDWHDYRNSQKGWTAKAKTLSANSLLALIEKGYDAQTIVNKSIENGWKGLFEPKPDKFAKPEVRPTFTKVEKTPEQIAQEKAEAQKAHADYIKQFGMERVA